MHAGNRFVRSLMLTLITAFLLLPLDAFAAGTQQAPSASSPLRLMLNGKLSKAVPILLDKTPYVPLEPAVFAVLGYKLTQSGSLYRFTSAAVSGEFGSDKAAIINNEPVTLPEAAIPYKGKRYAPLRLLSSLFGLEAVYRPKTGTIELKSTAGRQALLFGYITRQDGTPVKKGMLSMTTWSPALKSNVEVSATVTEGFFRVVLQPNTVYQPFSVFDFGFTNFILHGVDPITLQAGETRFLRMGAPKPNLLVHLQYPDGTPVKKATIFDEGHDPIQILNGAGGATVHSDIKQILFTNVTIQDQKDTDWDLFDLYQVPENGTGEITLTLKRPNVIIDLKDSKGRPLTSSLEVLGKDASGWEQSYRIDPINGKYNCYLPDGSYQLYAYYHYPIRQYYYLNKRFTVANGVSDLSFSWQMPDPNISGTVAFNDGANVGSGYISFSNSSSTDLSAWVNDDGTFQIYLPDGNYRAAYQPTGEIGGQCWADEAFVVRNGKAEADTDLIFFH